MTAKAVIRLQFSSEKCLESSIDALSPDVNHPTISRAKIVLENKGTCLILKVDADNTTVLRSTLNAYLRWIGSITSVIELLDHSS